MLPPVEFNDLGKSKIGNKVGDVSWNDDGRRNATGPQIVLNNCPQRRTMQVIEVRVRNQYEIDGGKIGDSQAWTAKPFQHEQPPRKVRIDQDRLAADLDEEARVPDEGHAEFSVARQTWLVSLA